MTWSISKDFPFSASHVLDTLPPEHKCSRQHGHNYIVRVTLTSDVLDSDGFVLDYGDMADFKRLIDECYDHRHLNDLGLTRPPTAEVLAKEFFMHAQEMFGTLVEMVGVSETPNTWAWYSA